MECPTCHQPTLPAYYFCPNCGTKLHEPPLATDMSAQLKLYAHSIILPFLAFLSVSKWQGMKYANSQDEKAKHMGVIAIVLLIVSTACAIWYAISFTQSLSRSLQEAIPVDLGE